MKRSLTNLLSAVILTSILAACGESAQEKLAKQELERREKEVQRMNEMRTRSNEAYAKLLDKPAAPSKEQK